jgi:hypothetical protein
VLWQSENKIQLGKAEMRALSEPAPAAAERKTKNQRARPSGGRAQNKKSSEPAPAAAERNQKDDLPAGKMARPKGFEPLTPRFVVWCSIQLS